MQTFEDYIKQMVKDGYWAERDLAPLKCHNCDSNSLEDKNHSFEDSICCSYERWCKDCGKFVNEWSYGHWDI